MRRVVPVLLALAPLAACASAPPLASAMPTEGTEEQPDGSRSPTPRVDHDPDGLGGAPTQPGVPTISFEEDADAGPAERVEGTRPTPEMPSFEILGTRAGDGPG